MIAPVPLAEGAAVVAANASLVVLVLAAAGVVATAGVAVLAVAALVVTAAPVAAAAVGALASVVDASVFAPAAKIWPESGGD